MDMNREGTVEGDDLATEQDVAAVADVTLKDGETAELVGGVLRKVVVPQQDIEQAISDGEQTERKVMAEKAMKLQHSLAKAVGGLAAADHDAAQEIAAYLARQAE